jgi:hypothetical protein
MTKIDLRDGAIIRSVRIPEPAIYTIVEMSDDGEMRTLTIQESAYVKCVVLRPES